MKTWKKKNRSSVRKIFSFREHRRPVIYFSFAIPKLPFAKIDKTTNTHEFSLREVVIPPPTLVPRSLEAFSGNATVSHLSLPSPSFSNFQPRLSLPFIDEKGAGEKFPIALPTSPSRFINDPTS